MNFEAVHKAMIKRAAEGGLDPEWLEKAKLQTAVPVAKVQASSGLTEHPKGYYGPVIGRLPNSKTVTVGDVGYGVGRGARALLKGLASKVNQAARTATPEQRAAVKNINDKYVKPLAPAAEALGNKLKDTWFGRGFHNGLFRP